MSIHTKQTIITTSKRLFALNGYEGFSMRILAKESSVGLSSIYHFFEDKDVLLKYIFDSTNEELGIKRTTLHLPTTAGQMLHDRILFQFQNIEDIVFLLKYLLHFRRDSLRLESRYLPSKAYLHIQEAIEMGVDTNEFQLESSDIVQDSKAITHAINGFLLEYYPDPPQGAELQKVVGHIHRFLIKSLTNKEVSMG